MHVINFETMFLRVHHNDFVPDSPKLHGVADEYLETLARLQIMFLISHHESSDQPQLFSGISFLIFMRLKGIFVINPVVVSFLKNSRCYKSIFVVYKSIEEVRTVQSLWEYFVFILAQIIDVLLLEPHQIEMWESLASYGIMIISF